ncbi:MAG: MarR family winged helix-turn-helix transcriptional regulator [Polyangiales bacterium]
MARKRAPRRVPRPRERSPVQEVVDETIALFHWLAWVAEQLYGDEGRGAARRWTLRRLQRHGALTVPALARARAIRRQSLQPVVDALVADGLVELVENPAHARSRLVRITKQGEALVATLDRIDERVLRSVGRGLNERDLAITSATLRALRRGFETGTRWRPAAAGG